MKPANPDKPISILANFICKWAKNNCEEGVWPYASFDASVADSCRQKDVERWAINALYLYYAFGSFLEGRGLIADGTDDDGVTVESLKPFMPIVDSNPLNFRARPEAEVMREFDRDWPPLCSKSRNKLEFFEKALERAERETPGFKDELGGALDDFRAEIESQAKLFGRLDAQVEQGKLGIVDCYKLLLPIWCVKEINPLFSMSFWEDGTAVGQLAERLAACFETQKYPSATGSYSHASYIGAVRNSLALYEEAVDGEGSELVGASVTEVYDILERSYFSLEHPCNSEEVPAWLYGKCQMIWNVVVCALLGPKEVIVGSGPLRTATDMRSRGHGLNDGPITSGQVILRRHFAKRGPEVIRILEMDKETKSRLWLVLGSSYDREAALPKTDFKKDYERLPGCFVATQELDASGQMVEGKGDSRFHLELFVKVNDAGERGLWARDLGSKNGSYVCRVLGSGDEFIVLESRKKPDLVQWARNHGTTVKNVRSVEKLQLERGDRIYLCDSCFDVL